MLLYASSVLDRGSAVLINIGLDRLIDITERAESSGDDSQIIGSQIETTDYKYLVRETVDQIVKAIAYARSSESKIAFARELPK